MKRNSPIKVVWTSSNDIWVEGGVTFQSSTVVRAGKKKTKTRVLPKRHRDMLNSLLPSVVKLP